MGFCPAPHPDPKAAQKTMRFHLRPEALPMKRQTRIDGKTWRRAALLGGLVALVVIGPTESKAQDGGRVFAVLAIDTDARISGLQDDGWGISAALTSGFEDKRMLNVRYLKGADVRPDVIVDTICRLPIGANDALLFYYTGHGATFEGAGHVLTTSHGNLRRSVLRGAMTARQPRLAVILTDCCASLGKLQRQTEPPALGAAPPPEPRASPVLRCLLLQHRGVVDLTSSSYGEASWSMEGSGGLFTHALATAMGAWEIKPFDHDTDGLVSWAELFEHVRRETQESFKQFKQVVLNQDPRGMDAAGRARLQKQQEQIPQAFALGETLDANPVPVAWQELFARNIGIHFEMVRLGTGSGARLTRNPAPGTAGAQVGLEQGDTIYRLDGLPIRKAADVMNHYARTTYSVIDVRTGGLVHGVMMLPRLALVPTVFRQEHYAANLGIYYQLLPRRGDTLGARLSRAPAGNTAAAALQSQRGDMIIRLDGLLIRGSEDVLNHIDLTTVEFVDVETERVLTGVVLLPGYVAR